MQGMQELLFVCFEQCCWSGLLQSRERACRKRLALCCQSWLSLSSTSLA